MAKGAPLPPRAPPWRSGRLPALPYPPDDSPQYGKTAGERKLDISAGMDRGK